MITPDNVNERWYGQHGSGMRRMLEQLNGYDPDYQRVLWSATKERKEIWHRSVGGTREWILTEVYPGREWRDRFMAAPVFVTAVLGFASEMPWAVNGRRGGAANPPNDACFTAANEIGGGLSLNVIAGGQDNDYTAIHWGDNYPVMLRKSPHYSCTLSPQQITQVAFMAGLVDDSRSTGTNAFALPDNAIVFHFDTDVGAVPRYIIRSNGVNVTYLEAAAPTAGQHIEVHIQTSENGEHIRFIFDGSVVVDWVDISGAAYADLRAAQLQPIFTTVNRAANQLRQLHLHDFRLIEDRGF